MMKLLASRSSRLWTRVRGLLLIAVLLTTIVLPGTVAAAPAQLQSGPHAADYELRIDRGANRTALVSDTGVLTGNPNIFVGPAEGIARVRFYIDPAADALEKLTFAEEPFAVAEQAPFRLAPQGRFNTTALRDGAHNIAAVIELTDGRTLVKTSRVQVRNGGPALIFDAEPLATLAPGGRIEQALRILTNTDGAVNYSITSDAAWLRVKSHSPIGNPETGVAPGAHIIEFNASDLPAGEHTATLTAIAEGFAPATITATLVVSAPDADCAPLTCAVVKVAAPYTLDFSQDHGFLEDKNGVGTGFTWVDKPTAGGTGYLPANLEMDTAASVLKITTTAGGASGANNNQDNALGVGIDAADQVSFLDTAVVNLPTLAFNYQQAGLWYGIDDDNYLKMVAIYDTAVSAIRAQFVEEREGALQQQMVSNPFPVGTTALHLRMRGDPVAHTITAYYSLDGATYTELAAFTVPVAMFNADAAGIDPQLGTRVFGGVFATHRFAGGPTTFQFDKFALTAQPIGPSAGSFAWDRTSFPFSFPSSLVYAKDGRLYATETWGGIRAISFNPDWSVASNMVIHTLTNRLVLGITEDPASTAANPILWVAHSDGTMSGGMFAGAPNSGIVSRFAGPVFAREDIITGLPRALANHSTNSLHFGPDGKLYIAQGGNTGAGAPNDANNEFGDRVEQPLSAALLVADVKAAGFEGVCETPLGSFDVPATCDVQVYASGMRNMYDFTFHPNGNIYGPDNGLGVDGTYPPTPTPPCLGPGDLNLHDPGIQPDLLNLVLPGKYYGHPNPYRNECVFKDGSWQGVAPLPNYVAPILNLGMNKSANGTITYQSDAFGGLLQGDLLITNYSVGDDIVRVKLSPDGQSVVLTERLVTGFTDPLPITEGPGGRLFVGEHASGSGSGKITILTPKPIGSWTTKTPMQDNLLDAGGAALNGKLYVVAGKDGVGPKRLMHIFDAAANTWSFGADLPASYPAVENPAVVAFNGKLYAFGGSTQAFTGAVPNAAVYDPTTNAWTDLPGMFTPRGGATAQAFNNEIWVMGGLGDNGASLSSVEIFNPASNSWRSGPELDEPRDNPGSAVLNNGTGDRIYVFGGRTRYSGGGEEPGIPREVEKYDPATGAWTKLQTLMPTGRRTPVVGLLDGKAQVIGGENNNQVFAANEEFDPVTETWRTLAPMQPPAATPRHGAAGGTVGAVVYAVAGSTAPGIEATNVNEAFSFGAEPQPATVKLYLPVIYR